MTPRVRIRLFLGAAAVFAVLLGFAFAGLGDADGPLGDAAGIVAAHAVGWRHVDNVVIATAFDIRGFDTLFEEMMIFVAAVGAVVLLRSQRGDRETSLARDGRKALAQATGPLVRAAGVLIPVGVVFGIFVVVHGHLDPGGGFQGGLLATAAFVVLFATGRTALVSGRRPFGVAELAHALGAVAFVGIALAGLVAGSAFLENVLPLGDRGALWSGGMIPIANIAVGIEVAAAFALIFAELADVVAGEDES